MMFDCISLALFIIIFSICFNIFNSQTLGVEDAIKCKTFITACNLQWRGKVTSNPVHYLHASELSSFTQVPKNREYRDAVEELKNSIKVSGCGILMICCLDHIRNAEHCRKRCKMV